MRPYDRARDLDAAKRIWREIGWGTSDDELALVEPFFDAGRSMVHDLNGAAESIVQITPGQLRYQQVDLSLAVVAAVATGHVARRQGLAGRLLARMLCDEAVAGTQMAVLGIFDQGFYDRLGFGTGPYEHKFTFDPATLRVDRLAAPPVRVTADDWEDVHACMRSRHRGHGAVTLDDPLVVKAELGWHDPSFGLGRRDDDGRLTHFLYGEAKDEYGPYRVSWLAYQRPEQLLELLAMLQSLGDQVHTVTIDEPADVQLQDLVRQPFRQGNKARGRFAQQAAAWWQARVIDLAGCVAAASFDGPDLRFNLELTDPIADFLPADAPWRGVAGSHLVTLGESSTCEPGTSAQLPTVRAGVAAFTRLLLGVRPATVLALTTDLDGPPDVMAALDRQIHLPPPRPGWDF